MAKDTEAKEKAAYEGQQVTTISLPRARTVRGVAYGPGENIRVPKAVADALTAEEKHAAKGERQGKGRAKKSE